MQEKRIIKADRDRANWKVSRFLYWCLQLCYIFILFTSLTVSTLCHLFFLACRLSSLPLLELDADNVWNIVKYRGQARLISWSVTSLGSSLLSFSLESSTHSSGSNVGVLDVAEMYSRIRLQNFSQGYAKTYLRPAALQKDMMMMIVWCQECDEQLQYGVPPDSGWTDIHLETLPNRSSARIEDDCSFTDHVYSHQNKLKST